MAGKRYGLHEKNRELGEAHACRARVPLHGDWAMSRGGYQEHVGDAPEYLTHDHACHRSRPGGCAYEEEHHRVGR